MEMAAAPLGFQIQAADTDERIDRGRSDPSPGLVLFIAVREFHPPNPKKFWQMG